MLGMPVQVLPQGPPPPPPAPKQSHLNVNGNQSPSVSRKSPQPQSFEPPPLGCRPEIKIPSNPMAILRKVPLPKPKEVDWTEEYRKERSKSPMPPGIGAEPSNVAETHLPEPERDFNTQQFNKSMPDNAGSPINTMQSFLPRQASLKENENAFRDQNNNYSGNNYGNNFNQNSPQQRVFSPFASSPQPNLPKPLSPVKLNQSNHEENIPIYVRQRATSPKPPTPQYEQGQASPVSSFQRQASLEQAHTPIYTRSSRNVSASPVKQLNQSTFQSNANDSPTENYPIYVRSFQKQQPPATSAPSAPSTNSFAPSTNSQPLSTKQPFINDPGRQYNQPNHVTSPPANDQSAPSSNQPMPPWMRRTNSKEIPEWANNADEFNRTSAPQANAYTNNASYPSSGQPTTQYGNIGTNSGPQQVCLGFCRGYFKNQEHFSNFQMAFVLCFRSELFRFNSNKLQQKIHHRQDSRLSRTKVRHHNTIGCSHPHSRQLVIITMN